MSAARRSRNPFRVLQAHPNFRRFWVGQTLSLIGSWMQTMALGWLSLQLSDSAFVVGLVASIGALPVVVLSMHAGAFVDRSDRLRLLRITQSLFLVQALVLWVITARGWATIPWLIALAFVQGVTSAIEIPARQSFIIHLVGREDLAPAIALNSSGFNLAQVVGPAIGGLVIHRLGIAWCFAFNALSFLAVLWGLLRIRLADAHVQAPRLGGLRAMLAHTTVSALEGLRHLNTPGRVRDLLVLTSVSAVCGLPFITLMPVLARDRLALDAGGYGTLLAALGAGGLTGALLIAGPASHWRRGHLLRAAGLAYPALVVALAATTSATVAKGMLFVTGVSMIIFNSMANSTLQLGVAEAYRGRLMAFYAMMYVGMSQLLGAFALGAAARVVGVHWAIGSAAGLLFAVAAWTFWRTPTLAEG